MDPFAEATEAVTSAGSRFDPTNAKRVREWFDGAERYHEESAAAYRLMAQKLDDEFCMDPDAANLARETAALHSRLAQCSGEAAAAFEMCHRDDLQRIDEPLPFEDKWDIGANRE